jgi:hypothetical protein
MVISILLLGGWEVPFFITYFINRDYILV